MSYHWDDHGVDDGRIFELNIGKVIAPSFQSNEVTWVVAIVSLEVVVVQLEGKDLFQI